MGYPDAVLPEPFLEIYAAIKKEMPLHCQIAGGYRFVDGYQQLSPTQLQLEQTVFNVGKIIGHQLRQAQSAVLFLCTAGKGIEKWCKTLNDQGLMMESYMVDMLANATVEAAMDRIQEILRQECQNTETPTISKRYSPGYCGWETQEQHLLFSFFPKNYCSIQLTDTALMLPIKSISGIIGLGKDMTQTVYPCQLCSLHDCIYRNRRRPETANT